MVIFRVKYIVRRRDWPAKYRASPRLSHKISCVAATVAQNIVCRMSHLMTEGRDDKWHYPDSELWRHKIDVGLKQAHTKRTDVYNLVRHDNRFCRRRATNVGMHNKKQPSVLHGKAVAQSLNSSSGEFVGAQSLNISSGEFVVAQSLNISSGE
ncbi:hypothetical protein DPMN_139649 [Dreissena polymorpha]|uniref:Uncharacterized protein n=1 Tax=Dreissena polymorpha TaxID=45954 RepID=A0A9D4G6N1_DREPO|nr:hypothetical protein DPMN_139649 [Dreissena polymorpha]